MPHPDGFYCKDTIVKDILADPNIHPGLLRAALNTLHSISSSMKWTLSYQATSIPAQPHSSGCDHQRSEFEAQTIPTSHSSVFDHQGSGLESWDADSNSSTNNSANHPQHPPSIIQFNKLKSDLEKQHRIDTECIKQNLTMQHNRDLQIVKNEAQRIIHVAVIQVKDPGQQALAQSRKNRCTTTTNRTTISASKTAAANP